MAPCSAYGCPQEAGMKVFPTGDPDNYRVVCWEDAPEPGTPGLEVRRLDGGA